MKYFADEPVNTGRQPEIDCLKAFCIVPMALLHTFETCAQDPSFFNLFVHILEFITGAASFMVCMGLGVRYSRHQSPRDYLRRGFELLTVGQLLNLLRNAIPNLIAWWIKGEQIYIANTLLIVETDIMTFAGFAFLLLALLKWLRVRGSWAVAIGLVMNAAGFALSGIFRTTGNYLLDTVLGFFVMTESEAYFPLCSYFLFVAFGYWLGEWYPRIRDKDGLSSRVLLICAPIAVAYYILRAAVPLPVLPPFMSHEHYILNFGPDALANCAMTVSLLALFHKLLAPRGGKAPGFVNHLSRHINQYYCITYTIAWPTATFLYAATGRLMPGVWLPLLFGIFTLIASYFLIEWNKKHWNLGIANLEGRRRTVVFSVIWALTVIIVMYAYPKIEVYANVWTNYLIV